MRFLKSYKSVIILLLSVILGCILGLIFKENTVVLKPFGDVFLNMMYTIVVSLVMLIVLFFIDPVGNTKIVLETTTVESANIGERIVSALTVTDFSHLLS